MQLAEAEDVLLKLIENVDLRDTKTLDEIDARFWCYLKEHNFKNMLAPRRFLHTLKNGDFVFTRNITIEYSRSRDALKNARPTEWLFEVYRDTFNEHEWCCKCWITVGRFDEKTPWGSRKIKTEELAELYAIILAIAYERSLKTPE